jgi:hypothetical protein
MKMNLKTLLFAIVASIAIAVARFVGQVQG